MSLCGTCAVTFNIFKRKNRCTACQLLYCTSCFKKGQSLPRRNVRHCMKCHAFSSNPYIESELMLLSIKELKSFIEQHNVPAIGCKEKQDLVELIMNHRASQSRATGQNMENPSSSSRQQQQQHQQQQSSSTSSPQFQNQATGFSPRLVIPPGIFNIVRELSQEVNRSNNESLGDDFFSSLLISSDGNETQQQQQQVNHGGCVTSSRPQPSTAWTTRGPSTTSSSTTKNFPLSNFKDASEIQCLSVKELKSILDKNFVDYKGCREKSELVQKVTLLWESKTSNENASKNYDDPTGESDLCKVCMDSVADCVLLECGHLVTCIECGKQLKECPMCRQHISRIVRVFKS